MRVQMIENLVSGRGRFCDLCVFVADIPIDLFDRYDKECLAGLKTDGVGDG